MATITNSELEPYARQRNLKCDRRSSKLPFILCFNRYHHLAPLQSLDVLPGQYNGYGLLTSKLSVSRAPSLKSLRFISSKYITNEGLLEALNKFPVLEELELSLCKHVFGKVYEGISIACPRLKCLKVNYPCFYNIEDIEYNKDEEALGIATMFVLPSLQLFGSELTNVGLATILDNCPHLEYLDIRHCFNIHMDITLRAKCARVKTMRLPHDSTDDYEFQIENLVRTRARKPR
ncbi:hypothetical protein CFC21_001368 [Triticum aestivum]|uniref:Uncharacterized protein n=1 Tax=Triticum aestivum TaxID=4565 RepID=A0A3B5XWY5_WHEAT|nr:hypothetical protein CFC21_001368 [Triticum aestivum]